jgi:hypothetical protein
MMMKTKRDNEKVSEYPRYTQEDMKVLHGLCREGSPLDDHFLTKGYDPMQLHMFLTSYHLDHITEILFSTKKRDTLKLINDEEAETYFKFRMMIGK